MRWKTIQFWIPSFTSSKKKIQKNSHINNTTKMVAKTFEDKGDHNLVTKCWNKMLLTGCDFHFLDANNPNNTEHGYCSFAARGADVGKKLHW